MLRVFVNVLPDSPLIGLSLVRESVYCEGCEEHHQMTAFEIGFLFFTIVFAHEKSY